MCLLRDIGYVASEVIAYSPLQRPVEDDGAQLIFTIFAVFQEAHDALLLKWLENEILPKGKMKIWRANID